MMVSVMVEMWVSVIDEPPKSVEVVAVYRLGISLCLINEVSPITNSRKFLDMATRSRAERLSTATRAGLNSSISFWIRIR